MERKKEESARPERRTLGDWFFDKALPRIFLLLYITAIAPVAVFSAAGWAANYPPGTFDPDKQSLIAVLVAVFLILIAERATRHTP